MLVNCEYCGKEFNCSPGRYEKSKHHCCSRECATNLINKINLETPGFLNCECPVCGKKFHLKEYQKKRYKGHCCSKECDAELRRKRMSGENNHQFGLLGDKNASWKSDEKITHYGYRKIRVLDHPFKDTDGFVFEHRLIAEKYLLTDENSIEINNVRYLKKEYDVHHIDENRLNNSIDNLIVLTKSEHKRLHNKKNPRERNSLGQFMKKAG